MANPHAEKQQGEEKIHGDAMEDAVAQRSPQKTVQQNNAIPKPDNGSHARSQE